MLKIRVSYEKLVSLKAQIDTVGMVYTEPQAAVSGFTAWAFILGDPTRVFVVEQLETPATFAVDFPAAMLVDAVTL